MWYSYGVDGAFQGNIVRSYPIYEYIFPWTIYNFTHIPIPVQQFYQSYFLFTNFSSSCILHAAHLILNDNNHVYNVEKL